ncbi:Vmc-like lipoprotein signal peptide domain-containing protein [Mycoplasmopsis cynos]|uniref:Vmc-like lipoprotein signal peptide domain-containing protein n=1 Tax=Mycoplasmopsis cynos TaxID=171284 RepID=UPI0022002382|nr:hypothetical protein [Mycoplasmopsis cynos]UWV82767.1 hypothetical protein NW067_00265 [Mycoplasmopsis cynos]
MNKYKKIFSGLGLLSISTLVGASVVACANKKPKASDSSTEAIDQNNNQGNSTTPEQGKPETPKEGLLLQKRLKQIPKPLKNQKQKHPKIQKFLLLEQKDKTKVKMVNLIQVKKMVNQIHQNQK